MGSGGLAPLIHNLSTGQLHAMAALPRGKSWVDVGSSLDSLEKTAALYPSQVSKYYSSDIQDKA
jgi:hypothetical protein